MTTVRAEFTFIGGATFEDTTSEFPTLGAVASTLRTAMADPRAVISWVSPDNGELLINPAAIAAVKLSEARP